MTLLVFYVALALIVSFLCSLLEASLLTITPSTIRSAEDRGARWAARLRHLKDDVERPLAAILTLNTVAHTMGAAGAGAQYAAVYGPGREAIFAAGLTLAVLIFTEIIPKTLGARHASGLAPFTAWMLPILITALAPLVWASRKITRVITFGKPAELPRHREELMAVASLGQASGQLQQDEVRFVRNMLQLHAVRIRRIARGGPIHGRSERHLGPATDAGWRATSGIFGGWIFRHHPRHRRTGQRRGAEP